MGSPGISAGAGSPGTDYHEPMFVLNLACAYDHRFEGWFASSSDFESQRERELISCPSCGNAQIQKLLSAPRLNIAHLRGGAAAARAEPERSAGTASSQAGASAGPQSAPLPQAGEGAVAAAGPALAPLQQYQEMQRQLMQAVQAVVAGSEDVGERFAEEARRIHYGESERRSIRGQASRADTEALAEEGIAVLKLPLPVGSEGPLQ